MIPFPIQHPHGFPCERCLLSGRYVLVPAAEAVAVGVYGDNGQGLEGWIHADTGVCRGLLDT